MKKTILPFKDKTFSNEDEILSELLSQVLMFSDSFNKLKMLTEREEYSYCPFEIDLTDLANLPFDYSLSDMANYINIWRKNIDKKIDLHESDSYIHFNEDEYKHFVNMLSLVQYSEEIKEAIRDIEVISINISILLKELECRDGNSIIRELLRRFYPFDLPFGSVSLEIRQWVNNIF